MQQLYIHMKETVLFYTFMVEITSAYIQLSHARFIEKGQSK